MAGWVYAFATPSMQGVVKIGATRRDPNERLEEANASDTWRPPRPYVVVCATEVADPFASERAIHALLAARRVNTRHEFFEITALIAIDSIILVIQLTMRAKEAFPNDAERKGITLYALLRTLQLRRLRLPPPRVRRGGKPVTPKGSKK